MSWEVFDRSRDGRLRPSKAPRAIVMKGCLYLNGPGVILAGLRPGDRVELLLERELGVLGLRRTESHAGWKMTRHNRFGLSMSVAWFVREVRWIDAGDYSLSKIQVDGSLAVCLTIRPAAGRGALAISTEGQDPDPGDVGHPDSRGYWLMVLSDAILVELYLFLLDRWEEPTAKKFSGAIIIEANRRGWPEGWWEDPSLVLSEDADEPSGREG